MSGRDIAVAYSGVHQDFQLALIDRWGRDENLTGLKEALKAMEAV